MAGWVSWLLGCDEKKATATAANIPTPRHVPTPSSSVYRSSQVMRRGGHGSSRPSNTTHDNSNRDITIGKTTFKGPIMGNTDIITESIGGEDRDGGVIIGNQTICTVTSDDGRLSHTTHHLNIGDIGASDVVIGVDNTVNNGYSTGRSSVHNRTVNIASGTNNGVIIGVNGRAEGGSTTVNMDTPNNGLMVGYNAGTLRTEIGGVSWREAEEARRNAVEEATEEAAEDAKEAKYPAAQGSSSTTTAGDNIPRLDNKIVGVGYTPNGDRFERNAVGGINMDTCTGDIGTMTFGPNGMTFGPRK